mmetsp:Transcript_16564/g.50920  ORF Transcript_16564/g.50920 Transcript_16564/m.50920 type:complete len:556 (-) Transcript_16564:1162-2829(-)
MSRIWNMSTKSAFWRRKGTMPDTIATRARTSSEGSSVMSARAARTTRLRPPMRKDQKIISPRYTTRPTARTRSRSSTGGSSSRLDQRMSRGSGAGKMFHSSPGLAKSPPATSRGELTAAEARASVSRTTMAARAAGVWAWFCCWKRLPSLLTPPTISVPMPLVMWPRLPPTLVTLLLTLEMVPRAEPTLLEPDPCRLTLSPPPPAWSAARVPGTEASRSAPASGRGCSPPWPRLPPLLRADAVFFLSRASASSSSLRARSASSSASRPAMASTDSGCGSLNSLPRASRAGWRAMAPTTTARNSPVATCRALRARRLSAGTRLSGIRRSRARYSARASRKLRILDTKRPPPLRRELARRIEVATECAAPDAAPAMEESVSVMPWPRGTGAGGAKAPLCAAPSPSTCPAAPAGEEASTSDRCSPAGGEEKEGARPVPHSGGAGVPAAPCEAGPGPPPREGDMSTTTASAATAGWAGVAPSGAGWAVTAASGLLGLRFASRAALRALSRSMRIVRPTASKSASFLDSCLRKRCASSSLKPPGSAGLATAASSSAPPRF